MPKTGEYKSYFNNRVECLLIIWREFSLLRKAVNLFDLVHKQPEEFMFQPPGTSTPIPLLEAVDIKKLSLIHEVEIHFLLNPEDNSETQDLQPILNIQFMLNKPEQMYQQGQTFREKLILENVFCNGHLRNVPILVSGDIVQVPEATLDGIYPYLDKIYRGTSRPPSLFVTTNLGQRGLAERVLVYGLKNFPILGT